MLCITPESIRVQISYHQRRKGICSSRIASTPFSLYAREEMSVIYLTKTNRLPVFYAEPDGCNGNHHPGRYRVLLSCSAHSPTALRINDDPNRKYQCNTNIEHKVVHSTTSASSIAVTRTNNIAAQAHYRKITYTNQQHRNCGELRVMRFRRHFEKELRLTSH